MATKAIAMLPSEDKKLLADTAIQLINSAPMIAVATALVTMVQWNLEHLAIGKDSYGKWRIKRLSTEDTSNLSDPNTTPLNFPVMSSSYRLLDKGADTAEIAANLAQKNLEATSSGGLLGGFQQAIFGRRLI